jgi:hypothetical protein
MLGGIQPRSRFVDLHLPPRVVSDTLMGSDVL